MILKRLLTWWRRRANQASPETILLSEDEIRATVITRAWQTGNMVFADVDEDGSVTFRERKGFDSVSELETEEQ